MADNKNQKKYSDLHNNRRYGLRKLHDMNMSNEEKKKTEKILKDAFENIGKPFSQRKRKEVDEVTISSNPFKVLADFVYTTDFDEIIDEVYKEIYDEAQSNKTISAEAEKELIIKKLKANGRLKQIYKTRFQKYESDKSWKGMGDLFFDYTAAVYSKKSSVKLTNETKILKYEALVNELTKYKDKSGNTKISKIEIKLLQIFLEDNPQYADELKSTKETREKNKENSESEDNIGAINKKFYVFRDKYMKNIASLSESGPTDNLPFKERQLVNLYKIEKDKDTRGFKEINETEMLKAMQVVYSKSNKQEVLNSLESHYVVRNYLGGADFLSKSYSEQIGSIKKTFEKEYIAKYFSSSELFYNDIKEELQEKLKKMLDSKDISDEERIELNAFLTNDNILLLILDNDLINLELRQSPPFNNYDDEKTISIYQELNNTVHGYIKKNNFNFQDKLLSSLKTDNDFIEDLFNKEIDSTVSTMGYQKHLSEVNSGTQDHKYVNVDLEKDNVAKMQYDYANETVATVSRSEDQLKKLIGVIFKEISGWDSGRKKYLNMPLDELLSAILDNGTKNSDSIVFQDLNKILKMSGYHSMLSNWSKDLNSPDKKVIKRDLRTTELKENFYDNDVNRDVFGTYFDSLMVRKEGIKSAEVNMFSDFLFELTNEFSAEIGEFKLPTKEIHNFPKFLSEIREKVSDNRRLLYYIDTLSEDIGGKRTQNSFMDKIGKDEFNLLSTELMSVSTATGQKSKVTSVLNKINGMPTLNSLTMGRLEKEYLPEYGANDSFDLDSEHNYYQKLEDKKMSRINSEIEFYKRKETDKDKLDLATYSHYQNLPGYEYLKEIPFEKFMKNESHVISLKSIIKQDYEIEEMKELKITPEIFMYVKEIEDGTGPTHSFLNRLEFNNVFGKTSTLEKQEIADIRLKIQKIIYYEKQYSNNLYTRKLSESAKKENKENKILTVQNGDGYTTIKNYKLTSETSNSIDFNGNNYPLTNGSEHLPEVTMEYSILEYIEAMKALGRPVKVENYLIENYYYSGKSEEKLKEIENKFIEIQNNLDGDIKINYKNPIMLNEIGKKEISEIYNPGEKYYMLYELKRLSEKYTFDIDYETFKKSEKYNDFNYTLEEFEDIMIDSNGIKYIAEYTNNSIDISHFTSEEYIVENNEFDTPITGHEKALYRYHKEFSMDSTLSASEKANAIFAHIKKYSTSSNLNSVQEENLINFYHELIEGEKSIKSIDATFYYKVSNSNSKGPNELEINKKDISFNKVLSETKLNNVYKMEDGKIYFINKQVGIHKELNDLSEEEINTIVKTLYHGNRALFEKEIPFDLREKNKRAEYQDYFFKTQKKDNENYMINKMAHSDMSEIYSKRKEFNFVGNRMRTNFDNELEISVHSEEEIEALKDYIDKKRNYNRNRENKKLGKNDKLDKFYNILDKLTDPSSLTPKEEEKIKEGVAHGFIPDYNKESYLDYAGYYLEKIGLVTVKQVEADNGNPNIIKSDGVFKIYTMSTKFKNEDGKMETFTYELTPSDLKTVVENFDPSELVKKMFLNKVYTSYLEKTGRLKDIENTYQEKVTDSYGLFEFKRLNGSSSYKEALNLINKNRSNMNIETIEKLNKIMASKDIGYITVEMNKILQNAENVQEKPNLEMSNRLITINEKMSKFFSKYSDSSILHDTLKRFIAGTGPGSTNPENVEEKNKITNELLHNNKLQSKSNSFGEFDFIIYISSHLNDIVETEEYKNKPNMAEKMKYLRELYQEMVKYSTDKDVESLDTKMETFKDILQEETIEKHGQSASTNSGIFSNKTYAEDQTQEIEEKSENTFNIKSHMKSIFLDFPNEEIEKLLDTPNITVEEYTKISIKYLKKVIKKSLNVDEETKKKIKEVLSLEKKASKEFDVTPSKR